MIKSNPINSGKARACLPQSSSFFTLDERVGGGSRTRSAHDNARFLTGKVNRVLWLPRSHLTLDGTMKNHGPQAHGGGANGKQEDKGLDKWRHCGGSGRDFVAEATGTGRAPSKAVVQVDGTIFLVRTRVERFNHGAYLLFLVLLLFRQVHLGKLGRVVNSVHVVSFLVVDLVGCQVDVALSRNLVEHGAVSQDTIGVLVLKVLFLGTFFEFHVHVVLLIAARDALASDSIQVHITKVGIFKDSFGRHVVVGVEAKLVMENLEANVESIFHTVGTNIVRLVGRLVLLVKFPGRLNDPGLVVHVGFHSGFDGILTVLVFTLLKRLHVVGLLLVQFVVVVLVGVGGLLDFSLFRYVLDHLASQVLGEGLLSDLAGKHLGSFTAGGLILSVCVVITKFHLHQVIEVKHVHAVFVSIGALARVVFIASNEFFRVLSSNIVPTERNGTPAVFVPWHTGIRFLIAFDFGERNVDTKLLVPVSNLGDPVTSVVKVSRFNRLVAEGRVVGVHGVPAC
mmetsp:Transcript_6852/g.14305  ORF Transcript_6852/g.14305 Transcript_6852/m.14305 type:complete len:509 (+) Transcript_6852:99-1625(+)